MSIMIRTSKHNGSIIAQFLSIMCQGLLGTCITSDGYQDFFSTTNPPKTSTDMTSTASESVDCS